MVLPDPRDAAMPSTTSLKLPDELKERISTLAHGVAQTPHAYMVEAIAQKVARDEKRRSFLEDARQSQEEVARTGIVYAHEDVMRWFRASATGKKTRKPRPVKLKHPR
jgi:predicted transcriptional regulator